MYPTIDVLCENNDKIKIVDFYSSKGPSILNRSVNKKKGFQF